MKITARSISLLAAAVLYAGSVQAGGPPPLYIEQPTNAISTIGLHNATTTAKPDVISDAEFFDLIKDTILKPDGTSNVKNATFLFQQCFAGGLLDEFVGRMVNGQRVGGLPSDLPFVAGAGSAWNQSTKGPPSRREINNIPGVMAGPNYPANHPDFFTAALLPGLGNPTASMFDIVGAGIIGDRVGTFGPGVRAFRIAPRSEFGQRVTNLTTPPAPGGTGTVSGAGMDPGFKLRDPDALSFHAVLLSGFVNQDRYRTDIEKVREQLVNAWGAPSTSNPNVTIDVLFGNGTTDAAGNNLPVEWDAKAATKDNLMTTLQAIKDKVDPNEQFFFYVSDHGDLTKDLEVFRARLIGPGTGSGNSFLIPEDAVLGIQADETNEPPAIHVNLDFPGTPAPGDQLRVTLNDTVIGTHSYVPGLNVGRFEYDESLVREANGILLQNESNTEVLVEHVQWDGPAISTFPALADDLPNGDIYNLWDDFDQMNEIGESRVVQLEV